MVFKASRVVQELMETLVHQDHLEAPGILDNQVRLVSQDRRDQPDKRGQRVHQAVKVHRDPLDLMVTSYVFIFFYIYILKINFVLRF